MPVLYTRQKVLVNTDPQRRCYNGAHFSSEIVWTRWEPLVYIRPDQDAEAIKKWWEELNAYAVKERGKSALRDFEIREV